MLRGSHSTLLTSSWDFSTECGFVGASLGRPKDDKAWNYIRPPPPMMKNILPKTVSEDAYEFVFLKNYPSRVVRNSDDPPDSFHSRDVFTPHKSIPNAWKYLYRLDDRVSLVNGEKIFPLPIEGRIRQDARVKEAVVFGVGRSIPGLLLFRSENAKDLSSKAFVNSVWPTIESANSNAESFSHIAREMIVPLPADISIPITDKGTVIRAQVYKVFEEEIHEAYKRLDSQQEGTMKLDHHELEEYLLAKAQHLLGPKLVRVQDDLFTMGMNSLQAIQLRGFILRDLDLGGNANKLSQNAVFEQGNIAKLSQHLHDLRLSRAPIKGKPIAMMKELVSRYAITARPRTHDGRQPEKNVIVGGEPPPAIYSPQN